MKHKALKKIEGGKSTQKVNIRPISQICRDTVQQILTLLF